MHMAISKILQSIRLSTNMLSSMTRQPESVLARQAPARQRKASLHCPWSRSFFTDSFFFFPLGFYTILCWCFSSWNLELLMICSQQSYSVCSFTSLILHTSTLPTSSQLSSFPGGLRQGYEAEPYPSQTFTGSCTLWRVWRRLQEGSERDGYRHISVHDQRKQQKRAWPHKAVKIALLSKACWL